MLCLLYGRQRERFIGSVERHVKAKQSEIDQCKQHNSPTILFSIVNKCMNSAMLEVFPRNKSSFDSEEVTQLKQQKKELFESKGRIMNQCMLTNQMCFLSMKGDVKSFVSAVSSRVENKFFTSGIFSRG